MHGDDNSPLKMEDLTVSQLDNLGIVLIVCQCGEQLKSAKENRKEKTICVVDLQIGCDDCVVVGLSNGMVFRIEPDGTFERIVD